MKNSLSESVSLTSRCKHEMRSWLVKERDSRYASLAVETSSRVIRESRVACSPDGEWAAAAARKWKEPIMATVVIVRVKGITVDGEAIDGEIEIVTDDPATDDIVEYYRKRFPLTTEAMGL